MKLIEVPHRRMGDDLTCRCEFPQRSRNHIQPGMYTCMNCGRVIEAVDIRQHRQPPPGSGEGGSLEPQSSSGFQASSEKEAEQAGRGRASEMARGGPKRRTVMTAFVVLMLTLAMSMASLYLQWGELKADTSGDGDDGDDGDNGTDGSDGNNGSDGLTSLLLVVDEPAGLNCSEGGLAIHSGLDIDKDGILDAGEISDTQYLCQAESGESGGNGTTGPIGPTGPNGSTGEAGHDAISEIIPLQVGNLTCPYGGIEIRMGVDLDDDGILDAEEIQDIEFVCNGEDGDGGHGTLMVTIAAPYTVCPDGFMLRFGMDDGSGQGKADDGVLHWDEASDAFTICTGTNTWSFSYPDIHPVSSANSFSLSCSQRVAFQAKLVFTAISTDGCELWVGDGRISGNSMILDINSGGDSLPGLYAGLSVHDGLIWFDADDGINGRELWVSDGTPAGTRMVADINAGPADSNPGSTWYFEGSGQLDDSAFGFHDGKVWFSADDGNTGVELWVSDGTQQGTQQVADMCSGNCSSNPGSSGYASFEDRLWYTADDGGNGTELWASDGSEGGTQLVADIDSSLNNSSSPGHFSGFTIFQDRLWFGADDGTDGRELWSSDGTQGGTAMYLDLTNDEGDSMPGMETGLVVLGELMVFRAQNSSAPADGSKIWVSDGVLGNTGGTFALSQEYSEIASADAGSLSHAGLLWFTCDSPIGEAVCSTDGTPAGTQVHELQSDMLGMEPSAMAVSHGYLYLAGDAYVDDPPTQQSGTELWRIPLAGGAAELTWDLWAGTSSGGVGYYGGLTNVENTLFFSADVGASLGHELHSWGEIPANAEDVLYLS